MKTGDYVRTKHKGIFKIDERCYFNKDFKEFWFKAPCDKGNEWTTIAEVIKLSPNIIDLIEVGDYVNGEKIIKIAEDFSGTKILIYGFDDGRHQVANAIYKKDIKSIVTKEKFESLEYRIES